jgi:PAS domain S-box-containing protein
MVPVRTVLLVDDFTPDREQYKRWLLADTNYAYRIIETNCAADGLEVCRTEAIDAILLDYSLPDTDGLDFLEKLSAEQGENAPPVVMITGDGNEAVAVRAMKLGAEDYLVKDRLSSELLQITMQSAIETAHLQLQLRQSDDRFRVSIENMLDCFGIFSAVRDQSGQIIDFRFDYLNAAALESNRMTVADLGKSLCETFSWFRESGLFDEYCRVVETGEPLVKENLIYSDTFATQFLNRVYDLSASKLDDGFVVSWRDVTARKQTEDQIRQANQQMTTIWESMTDAYAMLDREWRITYANAAAMQVISQLTGLKPGEFLGRSHWDIFPSLEEDLKPEYERALTECVAVHLEAEYEPTGNWFEIHIYPSAENLGIYFRDITDRKSVEETARQQMAEIEAIYTAAPVGLCYVDTHLRFVRINEQLAAINGLPVSEHIGRTLRQVLPEMADQLEPLYRQVIETGEPIVNLEVQGTNRARPGIERQWLVCYYPQKDTNQQVVGVNVVVQEITDRKQSEETLRQSEERYRYLSGLIPQHVWVANSDGMMLDVNERWTEYTGLTLEQAKIQGWQAIVHPEDVSILAQAWENAQMEGKSYQAEGRVRRADGVYEWYLHQAMPLMNEQGQITKWFGTATNIQDLKQIEVDRVRLLAEAEAAREEAELANRSKDEFVAVVAHELRSPLNSIAGWAKLLQTRKFDEATQTRALETIWRNTQTQVQLVEDLLDISRMVKGTLHLTLAPVNLASVVEAALDLVLLQAQAKQIRIDAQLAQIPQVLGDAARLQQIVVNLLNNALKFTPEQGLIEVQLYQMDSQACLCVKDTGKGIAPEFLSEVFDQFRQGQQNTGSKDGLGLGLAIVKNLVHLHRGTVSAASEGVGRGATFTVCLPLLVSAVTLPEST